VFDFFMPRLRVKTICISILPNRRFLRRFLSVFIGVHPWFIHLSFGCGSAAPGSSQSIGGIKERGGREE
jgi:hypothetical protein